MLRADASVAGRLCIAPAQPGSGGLRALAPPRVLTAAAHVLAGTPARNTSLGSVVSRAAVTAMGYSDQVAQQATCAIRLGGAVGSLSTQQIRWVTVHKNTAGQHWRTKSIQHPMQHPAARSSRQLPSMDPFRILLAPHMCCGRAAACGTGGDSQGRRCDLVDDDAIRMVRAMVQPYAPVRSTAQVSYLLNFLKYVPRRWKRQ